MPHHSATCRSVFASTDLRPARRPGRSYFQTSDVAAPCPYHRLRPRDTLACKFQLCSADTSGVSTCATGNACLRSCLLSRGLAEMWSSSLHNYRFQKATWYEQLARKCSHCITLCLLGSVAPRSLSPERSHCTAVQWYLTKHLVPGAFTRRLTPPPVASDLLSVSRSCTIWMQKGPAATRARPCCRSEALLARNPSITARGRIARQSNTAWPEECTKHPSSEHGCVHRRPPVASACPSNACVFSASVPAYPILTVLGCRALSLAVH